MEGRRIYDTSLLRKRQASRECEMRALERGVELVSPRMQEQGCCMCPALLPGRPAGLLEDGRGAKCGCQDAVAALTGWIGCLATQMSPWESVFELLLLPN